MRSVPLVWFWLLALTTFLIFVLLRVNRTNTIQSRPLLVPIQASAMAVDKTRDFVAASQESRTRFARVKAAINDRCKRFERPLSRYELHRLYKRLVVDDKHKVIYCPVWKSGSTSWRAVMLVLNRSFLNVSQAINYVHALDRLTTLMSYKNESAIEFRLKTYKKFTSYREPLNRFTADYLMLLRKVKKNFKIVKYADFVRGHPDPLHLWPNMSIRDFGEFVARFGNKTKEMYKLDKQWIPQNLACHPCHIKYDYHIDMESTTVAEDSQYILRMMNAPEWLKLPRANPTRQDKTKYLAQLSESLYNRLLSVYYNDYEIFGYEKREWSRIQR